MVVTCDDVKAMSTQDIVRAMGLLSQELLLRGLPDADGRPMQPAPPRISQQKTRKDGMKQVTMCPNRCLLCDLQCCRNLDEDPGHTADAERTEGTRSSTHVKTKGIIHLKTYNRARKKAVFTVVGSPSLFRFLPPMESYGLHRVAHVILLQGKDVSPQAMQVLRSLHNVCFQCVTM